MRAFRVALTLLVTLAGWAECKNWNQNVRVRVDPGRYDCYYIPNVKQGITVDVSLQVTDFGGSGGTGNLDISAEILDPTGFVLHRMEKDEADDFQEVAKIPGDYRVCLDNSYSRFSDKEVNVEMALYDEYDDYYDDYIDDEMMDEMRKVDQLDYDVPEALNSMKTSLNTIRHYVRTFGHLQRKAGSNYAGDSHVVERNAQKVTFWSSVHVCFLVAIGLIQVGMIKSLFSDKSFVHRIMHTAGAKS